MIRHTALPIQLATLMAVLALQTLAPLRPAHANLGETGFGSRATSLAGTGAAWNQGGFSAYSNPAALSLVSDTKFQMTYGWALMDPSFTPIRSVTLENSYTSDKTSGTETVGSVPDNYRSTLGQILGVSVNLAPHWGDLTLGATLYSPFDQLGFADTGETFIPEYVLYRARTQRPQFELGFGARVTQRLHVGIGAHVGFGLTSNATVFLQARDGKPSTMRITASAKPKASPVFGWAWKGDTHAFGQVLRLANSAASELTLSSSARAFGDLAAFDIRFNALSSLYYDPLSLETGWSWQYSPSRLLVAQIDIQGWRSFQTPAVAIKNPEEDCQIGAGGSDCSNLLMSPGILPGYPLRNIAIPRIAHEWAFERSQIRAGYAYRPSIFAELPTGTGNFLDPARHMATLGAGWRIENALAQGLPLQVDAHLLFHQLETQTIVKSSSTEAGDAGTKIGAPGYSAGGRVWGGGVSISVAI